jgi:hypothetical protein
MILRGAHSNSSLYLLNRPTAELVYSNRILNNAIWSPTPPIIQGRYAYLVVDHYEGYDILKLDLETG